MSIWTAVVLCILVEVCIEIVILAKVSFYILAAMKQQNLMYDLHSTLWSPRRPLGKENGDSKLIHAFVIYLLIPCKHLGRMKTYTFLKIILLYIVATMTNDTIRGGGGSPHCPQMKLRNSQWHLNT